MTGSNTYAHLTHANSQEYCCATLVCATHSESCVQTALHTHTAVTMLSAQRIRSAVYTPAFTCDGRDLYAGALEEGEVV